MAPGRETRRHPRPGRTSSFSTRRTRPGTASLEQLRAITDKLGAKLHVVVVTRENEEKIAPLLSPFLSRHISVALDTGGRIFSAFNVQYVPFGVLVDSRNRALWMGNSLQLTPEIIEKSSK